MLKIYAQISKAISSKFTNQLSGDRCPVHARSMTSCRIVKGFIGDSLAF